LAVKQRVSFKSADNNNSTNNETSMNSLNDENEEEENDIENENMIENDENYKPPKSSKLSNNKALANGATFKIAGQSTYKSVNLGGGGALTESTFSNELSKNVKILKLPSVFFLM
jgi:hypothetical protein